MTVNILATGDLMPGRRPARGQRASHVEQVLALLRESDLSFVNLETPLSDRGYPADKLINFRSPAGLAEDLATCGVTAATVANNHALDYGPTAMLDTLEALRTAGIAPVGGGEDLEAALAPAVVEVGGLRIALFGVACTIPTGYAAGVGRPGIASIKVYSKFVVDPMTMDEQPGTSPHVETEAALADVERLAAAIRAARIQCDHVLVGMHWGVAYGWTAMHQDYLAQYQQPLAHALIDAGADVIFGHHPHMVHGVEIYAGRPIFYSLGNFLFHALADGAQIDMTRLYPPYDLASLSSPITKESFVVRMSLPSGTFELIPTVMDADGEPVFPAPEQAEQILQRVDAYSERFGTHMVITSGVGRIIMEHRPGNFE